MILSDQDFVCQFADLDEINSKVSFVYEDAYAPHLAAKKSNCLVDLNVIKKDLDDMVIYYPPQNNS